VYFEAIHSKMKTFAPDSMAVFALETAGGINIAADAKPVRNTNIAYYGKERLLSRGGSIDVYLAQFGAMNRPTKELIMNEPGFKTIKAVSEGEIYFVDEQIVSRPTMRLLDGIYNIGKILYPGDYRRKSREILNRAKSPQNQTNGRSSSKE
jgi:iron complex transport system substrate-binding protein